MDSFVGEKNLLHHLSTKAQGYQFVCLFHNSSKMVDPNQQTFIGMILLGVQTVLGQKFKKPPYHHITLISNFDFLTI